MTTPRLASGSVRSKLALSAAAVGLMASSAWAQTAPQVASGDVSQSGAVLWAHASVNGPVTVEYSTDPAFGTIAGSTTVTQSDLLLPVKWTIGGLGAGARYYYRATDSVGQVGIGTFKTPATAGRITGFHMGISGDWRGELSPYPSVRNVAEKSLDLWIALGDTIYADVSSPAVPLAQCTTVADFRTKHNETLTARAGLNTLADLRASAPLLAVVDDHEVTDNFAGGASPSSDPRFAAYSGAYINETGLFATGYQVFSEYHPIANETYGATGDPRTAGKTKLYRSRRYGRDAAVILVDERSFRDQELSSPNPVDPNSAGAFLVGAFNPTRTMLGAVQLADLKADLLAAHTAGVFWKFIVIGEPIQNLGVLAGEDRYEGYAAERAEILRFVDTNHIKNVVFVSADIHGTLVNNLTYQNGPFQANILTEAFEISTGSVAYDAPFGPTVVSLAYALGLPGALSPAVYATLPAAQKEAYITGAVNAQITPSPLNYDSIGLAGSPIRATLLAGGYSATNTFGWTEFQVDATNQELLVTTWGIPAYTVAQAAASPQTIAAMQPVIVSQFRVGSQICRADFNGDGHITLGDVFDFISVWFAGNAATDFNGSGTLEVADIIAFLDSWFAGCP